MVETEMHFEDFTFDARRLSPPGLIINELITNLMKHAFVGRDRGLISISRPGFTEEFYKKTGLGVACVVFVFRRKMLPLLRWLSPEQSELPRMF